MSLSDWILSGCTKNLLAFKLTFIGFCRGNYDYAQEPTGSAPQPAAAFRVTPAILASGTALEQRLGVFALENTQAGEFSSAKMANLRTCLAAEAKEEDVVPLLSLPVRCFTSILHIRRCHVNNSQTTTTSGGGFGLFHKHLCGDLIRSPHKHLPPCKFTRVNSSSSQSSSSSSRGNNN